MELDKVLMLAGNGDVQMGSPFVAGARVMAEVVEQGRDKKILVFKYKSKTRYRRRYGHRQHYTRLAIRQILTAGEEPAVAEEKPKPKRAVRKKAAPKPRAVADAPPAVTEATEDVTSATVVTPTAPKTRRATAAKAQAQPEAKAPRVRRTPAAKAAPAAKPAPRPRRKPAVADDKGSVSSDGS